jgi:hypothetical protein
MTSDARLATGLPGHPKMRKLIRKLGQAAAWNFVCLVLNAVVNHPDGDLAGMTVEDIELAAEWDGPAGGFVAVLVEVRFLDVEDGVHRLHDWAEHQPWAAGAGVRSLKATWNAVKKYHGAAEADRQVPQYAAMRAAQHASSSPSSTGQTESQDASSNAGSILEPVPQHAPSPSPSPSPNTNTNTPLPPQGGNAEAKTSLPGAEDPMFVQFYGAYPRKTGRADAWRAWKALHVTTALFAEIMTGLELWKLNPRWTKDGGQFIKTPAPWLRQKLWADDEVCGSARKHATASAGHNEVCL